MNDFDAGGLGIGDRRLDLLEGLFLLEPVEDFWLPLSMPNMTVRHPDCASLGNRCCATESTRPSSPYLIGFLAAMRPSQIASMRLGWSRKWSSTK